jgi:molybdopterin biosynthesis enzyme
MRVRKIRKYLRRGTARQSSGRIRWLRGTRTRVVRLLAGQRVPILPALPAKLHGSIHAKLGRHYLVLGRAERDGAELFVTPLANQCSSLVRTSAEANRLIIVPPGDGDLESGTNVHVEMIPE